MSDLTQYTGGVVSRDARRAGREISRGRLGTQIRLSAVDDATDVALGKVAGLLRSRLSSVDGEPDGACGISCDVTECPRDAGMPGEAQDAEGEVAEAGHDVGPGAGAGLGEVFAESNVADPVQLVLDLPVAADPVGELGWLSVPGWQ
jgi:hypothetical protein